PPIYIGVSRTLRTRLLRHRRAVENVLRGHNSREGANSESQTESDTEEESGYFCHRVAQALRQFSINYARWLFVKIIELQGISRKELLSLERFLNRAFLPYFGRR